MNRSDQMRMPVIALAIIFAGTVAAMADGEINIKKPEPDAFGNEPSTTVTPKPILKINTVSEQELINHRDIGPTHARGVMANRPFVGIDDLRARSGLPSEAVERIKDVVDF